MYYITWVVRLYRQFEQYSSLFAYIENIIYCYNNTPRNTVQYHFKENMSLQESIDKFSLSFFRMKKISKENPREKRKCHLLSVVRDLIYAEYYTLL